VYEAFIFGVLEINNKTERTFFLNVFSNLIWMQTVR